MRDKSHEEQIIRWAKFVRKNPYHKWKPAIKGLIDSQIIMANKFYSRLAKTKGGKEKIKKLRYDKSNNI